MGSNLERDIENKSKLLKKGIKELQNILGSVYTAAKKANNNKLIFIKRDVDKLNDASKFLNSLDLSKKEEGRREGSFKEEIAKLHEDALKSITKMQELYKKQEAAEKKDLHYNGRFFSDQKNLDNLRLAHSNIRQMGVGLRMSNQDWNEIEKK